MVVKKSKNRRDKIRPGQSPVENKILEKYTARCKEEFW